MDLLHGIARISVEWMLYCLLEGSLLALFAWVLLRLLPRQNAGTRFALWFSVLLATIFLPLLAGDFFKAPGNGSLNPSPGSRSFITLPDSAAIGIFAVWGVLAGLALLRVAAGLWQVSRIRRDSEAVPLESLDRQLSASLAGFPRPVSLRVSDRVQVPAAIGFLQPAVVIPRWFLEEMSAAELQQVIWHELTHLRRRDDWTNLAQKIIKAVLFFHPLVWWIEQRLSLEREMACDDAVLARSASPLHYAECLARLAEKSAIRKRISLAQAAVGRMRQLSLRVAQILDVNRPGGTRIWKPAVPIVAAAAALCGFSAWSAPALVSFQNETAVAAVKASPVAPASGTESEAAQLKVVLASASLDKAAPQKSRLTAMQEAAMGEKSGLPGRHRNFGMAKHEGMANLAQKQVHPGGDYVVSSEQWIVATTVSGGPGHPQAWQVSMWQVSIVVPSGDHAGKTISRKKI